MEKQPSEKSAGTFNPPQLGLRLYSINIFIQLRERDEEAKELKAKLDDLGDDFQNLQETKNALDTEIAVYRKLMETEENRLGIEIGLEINSYCPQIKFYFEIAFNPSYYPKDKLSESVKCT